MAFIIVFVSILSSLILDVIIKKGSLIFIKMSEELEIDAEVTSQIQMSILDNTDLKSFHLNFTRVEEL